MGDRVAVLNDGLLQQVDTPLRLYDDPTNLFVAGFIGSPAMNLLGAKPAEGGAQVGESVVPLDRDTLAQAAGRPMKIGVRPEALRIRGEGETGLPVRVVLVEELGADAFVHGTTDTHTGTAAVIARVDPRRTPHKGATVHVTADPQRVLAFDADTGSRLT
jgi:multiple sugar transport system ATP-binding protein